MNKLIMCLAVSLVLVSGVSARAQDVADEKSVLMVLWRGITEPEVEFKKKLADMGFRARFTEVVGDQDRGVLAGRMRAVESDIVANKFDVIYSFGTTTTQVVETVVRDRVPVVFNIVFDAVGGKLVQSMTEPGVNVTGVTNGVPMDDQLNAFNRLTPMKKLIVLFNAREPNSNIIQTQVQAWGAKSGVTIEAVRVAPNGESLDQALKDIQSGTVEGDSLYAGADSFLGSKSSDIFKAIGDKVKLFGGTETFVLNGWLAAFTPTVADMGGAAAELVVKVAGGQDARKTPVVLPTPRLIVSKSTADNLGVSVPLDAVLDK